MDAKCVGQWSLGNNLVAIESPRTLTPGGLGALRGHT